MGFRAVQLVSPLGRDVAQRQRGLRPSDIAFQICPDTNLPAFCPLSHLLCKCQLSQGESREAGANCTPDASGELLRRLVRVLLLLSRLAPRHLPQGGRLWVSAQSKLVSSLGRDVAQRQRGLERFPQHAKTAAAQTAAVSFPSLAYSESRFVMLSKLMPKVDRLCSMADVAGWSTPATPSRIKPRLKPMIKR